MSLESRIRKVEQKLDIATDIKYPTFSQAFLEKRTAWCEWMLANNKASKALDKVISSHRGLDSFYEV
jgi:hypothetical protein